MVNVPKTKKTYCKNKECRKHTLHKVTQYKKAFLLKHIIQSHTMVEYNICLKTVAKTPENIALTPSVLTIFAPIEIGPSFGVGESIEESLQIEHGRRLQQIVRRPKRIDRTRPIGIQPHPRLPLPTATDPDPDPDQLSSLRC
ncbi:hypothetical protein QQ045_002645 [Rhodiola kirilowii]